MTTPPDESPAARRTAAPKRMQVQGYDIDILVQGFPGKSVCHGGLGWSTIALLRGHGRVVLIDVGPFGMRRTLKSQIERHGLKLGDVTDVLLTHAHHDHAMNWVMFPNARVQIGGTELDWAVKEPMGSLLVPELYIRELAGSPQLRRIADGAEILPGISAHMVPGHTPGSLIYVVDGGDRDVVFTGDAAKNRAELLVRAADLTMDPAESSRSIAKIWQFWEKRPDSILVPGHDIPMVLEGGQPKYLGKREAAITAWFDDELEKTTLFELAKAA
ncbi:MAG: MBL fold metallo-hydrolase [Alphaproteobacteria bacterium]